MWHDIPIQDLQFTCLVTESIRLPPFRGHVLRTALHEALRRSVCPFPASKPCAGCELRTSCPYPRTTGVGNDPSGDGRPLFVAWFDPATPDVTDVGGRMTLHMRLFGPAVSSLTYFVYAMESLSRFGIGLPDESGRRGRFVLERVSAMDREGKRRIVFDRSGRRAEPLPVLTAGDVVCVGNEAADDFRTGVRVVLQAPLRIKREGRLTDRLPFGVLMRAVVRRLHDVYEAATGKPWTFDVRGLLERAERVETRRHDVRWFDYSRYSRTHGMRLKIGGMIGSVTYAGEVGEFLEWLRAGAFFAVGRSISFGLGRYDVVRPEEEQEAAVCAETN